MDLNDEEREELKNLLQEIRKISTKKDKYICPMCNFVVSPDDTHCLNCGTEFEVEDGS